jgi:hypothetical protein
MSTRDTLNHTTVTTGETTLVKLGLKRLGREDSITAVTSATAHRLGHEAYPGQMTFDAFHEVHPGLPVRFASPAMTRSFHASHSQLAELLTRPAKSTLVRRQDEVRDSLSLPDDVPVAVVFRAGRTPGGWALHDGDPGRHGNGHLIALPNETRVMSRFYTVLDALSATPQLDDPGGENEPSESFDWDLPLPRSVRKRYGQQIPSQVLGLLVQLTSRLVPERLQRHIMFLDGTRWFCLTQSQIAGVLGCSTDGVKKAMKRLADDGWVDTRRTFKGNVIRLTAKGKAVLLEEVDRVY